MTEHTNQRAVYGSYGGPHVLYVEDAPRPHPRKGELLIRQMVSIPKTQQLATLTALVESGTLCPVIDSVYPLDEIAAAHERAEQHGTVGKIVIDIARR